MVDAKGKVTQLAPNFWNMRGSFKIGGVLDVGTHMSIVRKDDGRFLVIDSYSLADESRSELLALTDDGRAIDAILNVHPFHTLHCRAMHELVPNARLFGTRRHHLQEPDLPWEAGVIEDEATQRLFVDQLEFSVPSGVDFVCPDPSVHVASVMVRDRTSSIVHVDDTLGVLAAPGFLGRILPQSRLRFHPMLVKALQARPGAADAFEQWARTVANEWNRTPIVCAAHSAVRHLSPGGWQEEVLAALELVEKTLDRHRGRHG